MSVHTVQYEGIEIEYELTRKNVKYINLRVNKYGKVVVSAGEQVPFAVIDEFVQSKAFWIITHLAEIEKIRNEISDASLYDGKTVYYLSAQTGTRRTADYGCGGYDSAFLPEAVFRCAEGGISGLAEGAGGEEICGNYG